MRVKKAHLISAVLGGIVFAIWSPTLKRICAYSSGYSVEEVEEEELEKVDPGMIFLGAVLGYFTAVILPKIGKCCVSRPGPDLSGDINFFRTEENRLDEKLNKLNERQESLNSLMNE